MSCEIQTLPNTTLEKPHHISRNMAEARRNFWELAQSRINYQSHKKHSAFEKAVTGKEPGNNPAAYYIVKEEGIGQWVVELQISINKDLFDKENEDLLPYIVEHEIFEAWMFAKRGLSPQSPHINHLLATRHQFRLAIKDGNGEKMRDFRKRLNPHTSKETDYAYNAAKRKFKAV